MPVFQYEALDEKGNEVKAEIEALSSKEAISKIRNKGFFPTKVRAKGAGKKVKAKTAAKPKKRRGAGGKVNVKAICPSAFHTTGCGTCDFTFTSHSRTAAERRYLKKDHRICGR